MATYNIGNAADWETAAGAIDSGASNTINITNHIPFMGQPTEMEVGSSTTVNGGNYVLSTYYSGHKGFFKINGATINDLHVNGRGNTMADYAGGFCYYDSFGGESDQWGHFVGCTVRNINVGRYGGGFTSYFFGDNSNASTITRCITYATLTGTQSGGFVGHGGNLTISDSYCEDLTTPQSYTSGFIGVGTKTPITIEDCLCHMNSMSGSNTRGGFIGSPSMSGGVVNITRCAVLGGNCSGGGCFVGRTSMDNGSLTITDCYSANPLTGGSGFISSTVYTTITINIVRGYQGGSYSSGATICNDPDADINTTELYVSNATMKNFGTGNILGSPTTNLNDVDQDTLEEVGANWTSAWTASGTDSDGDYHLLTAFTQDPWFGYTTWDGLPVLKTVTGSGGDPYIYPIYGITYKLPTNSKSILLFDNKDKDNHVVIKGLLFSPRRKVCFFEKIKVHHKNDIYVFDCIDVNLKVESNNNKTIKKKQGRELRRWTPKEVRDIPRVSNYRVINVPNTPLSIKVVRFRKVFDSYVELSAPLDYLEKCEGALISKKKIKFIKF